jgi:hypothetical protein
MTLRFFLFVSCLLSFDNVYADHHAPDKSWTFTFRLENDLFAGTDRHYTNGIKLSWISPDLTRFRDSDQLPDWGKQIVNRLPYSQMEGLQRNIVFSIGQNMYTPADIEARELLRNDRPYAGWLYGSAAFHNKDYRHLDTFEVQAGFVGPVSLAEETQDLIHDLRGIDKANGWDNQIKNEPGLNLIYEHKDRILTPVTLSGFGFDAITHYGGALGNVFTYANAGLEMRLGWNLPTDFGTSLLRPGGETNAPADTQDPRFQEIGHGFSLHAFAAVSGRMVFHDIFLDGNTFRDSHSVDKEFLVGDLVYGISLIVDSVKVSYAQVLRTREFEGQDSGQNFGSISISYTY